MNPSTIRKQLIAAAILLLAASFTSTPGRGRSRATIGAQRVSFKDGIITLGPP